MEANEMQEFANQLHEANESGDSRESGGESLQNISLAISILAVLVAMVTVLGHRTHTEAVLLQAKAGDQWNLYQAKKIRMENLMVSSDLLALQTTRDAAATSTRLHEYHDHITKWQQDLAEEQAKAREFEAEVEVAEHKASHFDLGEAMLQIAVVLASITLFTRNRAYFFLGIAIGVAGVAIAASGLLVH
ncbi:MAG: DUF4337 domain-containing protein [Acidobacteriota bacterium]|nr:DUF4337 domain-containing protein [Acidobacteriota bacterium]